MSDAKDKHTPKRWKGGAMKTEGKVAAWWAKKGSGKQGVITEDGGTGRTVAVVYDAKDAVLLAAAPEMLAALQGLLATCELNTDEMEDETRTAIRAAQDAVRNARGEL